MCERVRIHNPEQGRRTFRASLREAEILDFLYIKKKRKKKGYAETSCSQNK